MCECMPHMWVSAQAKEDIGWLRAGVIGGCEILDMCVGCQTWVLGSTLSHVPMSPTPWLIC